jgi:putative PIN family toxin of toxin-antitoxin system
VTKIVIDTNIIVSGIFWGGLPRSLLELVDRKKIEHYATPQIVEEYGFVLVLAGGLKWNIDLL